jgi:hypothetical protein
MDVVTETVAEVVGWSCKLAACTTDRGPTTFAVSSITAQRAQRALLLVTARLLLAFSLYAHDKWRRRACLERHAPFPGNEVILPKYLRLCLSASTGYFQNRFQNGVGDFFNGSLTTDDCAGIDINDVGHVVG